MEVPTIYKAYVRAKFQGIYPQFIWSEIWYLYVPPIILGSWRSPIDEIPAYLKDVAFTSKKISIEEQYKKGQSVYNLYERYTIGYINYHR